MLIYNEIKYRREKKKFIAKVKHLFPFFVHSSEIKEIEIVYSLEKKNILFSVNVKILRRTYEITCAKVKDNSCNIF